MMKKILSIAIACLAASAGFAQIRLPQLVRDSMVLQRDTKIRIWGWAAAGEKISVKFRDHTYHTRTDAKGNWAVWLQPKNAGGPYRMQINNITLRDILVGDVWVCSGQSNMVHQMRLHSVRYAKAIADAHYSDIRQFWIPTVADPNEPHNDLPPGYWKSANPRDVLDFSAVAYFFAKDIYEKHHIPIGLINASVGGSRIEAWMSEAALKAFPALAAKTRRPPFTPHHPQEDTDPGVTAPTPWFDPAYAARNWRPINIPGYWEDQGLHDLDGTVWYRRYIDVPAEIANNPAKVFLGRIVDADFLYINGRLVGNTTYMYPQRRYPIPAGVLKPGKNLFVIRVINTAGKGGFVPDKPYQLIGGGDTIDLKGYWEYKVGAVFTPRPQPHGHFSPQDQPAALYNAMLAPVTPYTIKGFLWYQGESNTSEPGEYARLQPAMIEDWRGKWGQGNLPFLFVQLPGFGDYRYLPAESETAELRAAQAKSLGQPNTAMAVAIDLGEWNDIHPDRKKEVGDRLALAAERLAYNEPVVYSGPTLRAATMKGDTAILSFDHTGGGLVTNDGDTPQEFALAGPDKKFVWAHAQIAGNTVMVWNETVQDPKYVRYAWADEPVDPNLFNKEGLPASPFSVSE